MTREVMVLSIGHIPDPDYGLFSQSRDSDKQVAPAQKHRINNAAHIHAADHLVRHGLHTSVDQAWPRGASDHACALNKTCLSRRSAPTLDRAIGGSSVELRGGGAGGKGLVQQIMCQVGGCQTSYRASRAGLRRRRGKERTAFQPALQPNLLCGRIAAQCSDFLHK